MINIIPKVKKVKFSLCLVNQTPCNENLWGNGRIAPPFFTSTLDEGEWSASRPGSFTPGKSPPVPIGWEAGWAPEPVWTMWAT
jgi:hypothetical protein